MVSWVASSRVISITRCALAWLQARSMIWALEDRSKCLEERKKALFQRQTAYLSKIVELSGKMCSSITLGEISSLDVHRLRLVCAKQHYETLVQNNFKSVFFLSFISALLSDASLLYWSHYYKSKGYYSKNANTKVIIKLFFISNYSYLYNTNYTFSNS